MSALVAVTVYHCESCGKFTEEEPPPLRECSRDDCNTKFVSEERNCTQCNRPFSRRIADWGCEDCDEEMEQVDAFPCTSCEDGYHLTEQEVTTCAEEAALPKPTPKPKEPPPVTGLPVPSKVWITYYINNPDTVYLDDDSRITFQTPTGRLEVRMERGLLEIRALDGGLSVRPSMSNGVGLKSLPLFREEIDN